MDEDENRQLLAARMRVQDRDFQVQTLCIGHGWGFCKWQLLLDQGKLALASIGCIDGARTIAMR